MDYALRTRQTLEIMAAMIKEHSQQLGNGDDNPIARLERLNIDALRSGKGREAIAILGKHDVTRFEDVPLGRYTALVDDFIALLDGTYADSDLKGSQSGAAVFAAGVELNGA